MSLDFEVPEEEQQPKQSNRTFTIIAGILAAVILISLVAIAAIVLFVSPKTNEANLKEAALVNAQNTAIVMEATSAAMTALAPTETPIPPTEMPTNTPLPPTATPTPEATLAQTLEPTIGGSVNDQLTATVAALLTQASGVKGTPAAEATLDPNATPGAVATALPTTGFADEVGLPGLAILTVVLLGVILVTRRARTAAPH